MSNLLTVPDHPTSAIDANKVDTLQKMKKSRLLDIGERITRVETTKEGAPTETENYEKQLIASRNRKMSVTAAALIDL